MPVAQMDPLEIGQKLLVSLGPHRQLRPLRPGLRPQLAAPRSRQPERPRRRLHQRSVLRPHRRSDRNLQRSLRLPSGQSASSSPPASASHPVPPSSAKSSPRNTSRLAPCSPDSCSAPAPAPISTAPASSSKPSSSAMPPSPLHGAASASPSSSTVRYGFGGHMHVMAARKALDRALELDPGSVEANLYRVYMLLSRGEKESARHGIEHLLQHRSQRLERPPRRRHHPPPRRHVRGGA